MHVRSTLLINGGTTNVFANTSIFQHNFSMASRRSRRVVLFDGRAWFVIPNHFLSFCILLWRGTNRNNYYCRRAHTFRFSCDYDDFRLLLSRCCFFYLNSKKFFFEVARQRHTHISHFTFYGFILDVTFKEH